MRNQDFAGENLSEMDIRRYGTLAIIGIVILTVGVTISLFTRGFYRPGTGGFPITYTDPSREIIYTGAVVYVVGVAVLSASLISSAIFEKKFDQYTRLGLLIAGALILGLGFGPGLNAMVPYLA
jgi:hypothetical protein